MIKKLISNLQKDWKRTYAITVVYGYMYDIIFWPFAFWLTTMATLWSGIQFPAPPLVPWEQLAVATVNLAVIGTIQWKRDQESNDTVLTKTIESKTTEVKVKDTG